MADLHLEPGSAVWVRRPAPASVNGSAPAPDWAAGVVVTEGGGGGAVTVRIDERNVQAARADIHMRAEEAGVQVGWWGRGGGFWHDWIAGVGVVWLQRMYMREGGAETGHAKKKAPTHTRTPRPPPTPTPHPHPAPPLTQPNPTQPHPTTSPNHPTTPQKQDLIRLTHMNEPSVLAALARRYAAGDIYTRTGAGIVIAINPFTPMTRLYNAAAMDAYRTEGASTDDGAPRPPHIFSVASQAYWRMRRDGKGQALLVTGESGAGKTETSKLLMKYLAYLGVRGFFWGGGRGVG
jgi:hypothetical protein